VKILTCSPFKCVIKHRSFICDNESTNLDLWNAFHHKC